MLKSVPSPMQEPFVRAEAYVEKLFGSIDRQPSEGTLRVGGERYVLMRCESLYLSWFDALAETFGADTARAFVYNTAREIGRSDSRPSRSASRSRKASSASPPARCTSPTPVGRSS